MKHLSHLLKPNANNKDAEQPEHSRSLISAFVVLCLDSIIPTLAKSCSWAGCLTSHLFANPAMTGFLVTWLKWLYNNPNTYHHYSLNDAAVFCAVNSGSTPSLFSLFSISGDTDVGSCSSSSFISSSDVPSDGGRCWGRSGLIDISE